MTSLRDEGQQRMDRACPAVLARLQRGPATTIELQAEILTTHVAKPIFDLRQAGHNIATKRLPNGVALYTLRSGQDEASGEKTASPDRRPAPSRAPVFGDPEAIRALRKRK